MTSPPENPFATAAHGRLLGGQEFVNRIRKEMRSPRFADEVPEARSLRSLDAGTVFAAVSTFYDVEPVIFGSCGNGHIARAVAAWLARRQISATWMDRCVPLELGKKGKEARLFKGKEARERSPAF